MTSTLALFFLFLTLFSFNLTISLFFIPPSLSLVSAQHSSPSRLFFIIRLGEILVIIIF